jgi:4-amino-4-deoxy-L-arabinose transferase-like glycosyltransferase
LDLRKYYPAGLLVVALLLFFPALGARDLWAPVEPRYAEIVRVMFSKGEWTVPTVNGELYTDKPILYFWVALVAAKLTGGVNEWVVRLPAALGGVGFVLATYFFGRDFYSARVGALAAMVLATSFRVIWEARWAHVDMLFGFFFLLSIYFGARTLLRRGGPNEILLAYVFMALATLTKGLIGVVLPALLFISFMVARRDWSMLRAARLPLGIALFALVVAPWFYLVNRASGGQWLSDFIYIHHLQRYTAGTGHRQPFYYYFTTLPADFLPWTAFLLPALITDRDYRNVWRRPEVQFSFLWFLTVFIFFTVSDTKRDLYLLPLLPALALLVANYLSDLAAQNVPARPIYFWITSFFFGSMSLAGLALPVVARFARADAFGPVLPASLVLAAGGIATVVFILFRRPMIAAVSVSAMMMLISITVSLWMFPYLESFKSHRRFSLEINRRVPPPAPLYVFSDTMNDFNYYTQREKIPVLTTRGEIERLRGGAEKSYLLVKERSLKQLPPIAPESIRGRSSLGNTTWYLVEMGM